MSETLVTAPIAESAKATPVQRIRAGLRIGSRTKDSKQNNLAGYFFISPWLIGFFLFALIPIALSLWLAFTDYDILGKWHFVGLDNFVQMFFKDIRYGRSVRATLAYVIVSVPVRLAVALGI